MSYSMQGPQHDDTIVVSGHKFTDPTYDQLPHSTKNLPPSFCTIVGQSWKILQQQQSLAAGQNISPEHSTHQISSYDKNPLEIGEPYLALEPFRLCHQKAIIKHERNF